ncbi:Saposin B-type domain-containing protein [Mycena venus]|uniref:Saposin B-type domain-containing protein n=1 Tax=Mycena venus TaxID=2733690 RepID=A0A8H6YMD8_9AGAR|nr:Saposin B-type domain-containing protein [Mycena venus]
MSSSPSAIPPLDGVLGVTLIGGVLGTFLFGLGTLQTFHYCRLYSSDSKVLKTLVAAIWLIELAHSISLWHALYQMTVTFYGQLPHLFNPPHSLEMTVLFAALINLIVQTFFAVRIRTLSGSWFIPVISSLLTGARFAVNVIMVVGFWTSTSGFEILHTKLHWAMVGVSTIGPSVDILIAASLCFYLWRIRSTGSQFEQTRTMVDSLIRWSRRQRSQARQAYCNLSL